MPRVSYSWTSHDAPSRRRAYVATGLVQVALLALLLWFCFETPLPLPGEEGIAIAFGAERGGAGQEIAATPTPQPLPQPVPVPPKPLVSTPDQQLTQDHEEAPEVAVKPAKPMEEAQPKPKPSPDPPKPAEPKPEPPKPAEPKPEPPKPTVNPAALFPGRTAAPDAPGRGSGGEAGNQGSPQGEASDGGQGSGQGEGLVGSGRGRGAGGEGISYSLGSRSALQLPPPEYPTQRSGKVVVKVWVNKQGRVLRAEAGEKGSTTFDQALLRAAQAAAMQAQFDVSADAPDTQVGSITYVFRLKQ